MIDPGFHSSSCSHLTVSESLYAIPGTRGELSDLRVFPVLFLVRYSKGCVKTWNLLHAGQNCRGHWLPYFFLHNNLRYMAVFS